MQSKHARSRAKIKREISEKILNLELQLAEFRQRVAVLEYEKQELLGVVDFHRKIAANTMCSFKVVPEYSDLFDATKVSLPISANPPPVPRCVLPPHTLYVCH